MIENYVASGAEYTDNHEILLTTRAGQSSTAHIFGYDLRFVDLSSYGGPPDALVAGHLLARQSGGGRPVFAWSIWDHFSLVDCLNPPISQASLLANTDFDHPNSLDFDIDGNYIVSIYRMNAIVKINAQTGQVMWQLGGLKNQFAITNDPLAGFGGQHSARVLENGHLLIYDNGMVHNPPETVRISRARHSQRRDGDLRQQTSLNSRPCEKA